MFQHQKMYRKELPMETTPMLDRENGTIYYPTRQKGVLMGTELEFPELFNPLG